MTPISITALLLGATTLILLILYLMALVRNSHLSQQLIDQDQAHHREINLRGTLQEQLTGQIKAMEDRFTVLSETITKQRAEELTTTTSTTLSTIIQPLQDSIREVRQSLSDTTTKETDRTARLEQTIKQLTEQSLEIGQKADSLAEALRLKPKVQGNWGETQLEVLLEREGFQKGKHYDTQPTLRTETNTIVRPDFVFHLPDNRDVIIDAKVSLTAFLDYIEAKNDEDRQNALDRHTKSLRGHIQELSGYKYQQYIPAPRQALEYILMFVPNTSAIQLAYTHDPSLIDYAKKANVLITSEANLYVLLRLIQLSWKQDTQVKNFAELTTQVALLLERTQRFMERFETIQERINALQKSYDDTNTSLRGRQGLLGTANRINTLSSSTTTDDDEHMQDNE